MLCTDDRHRTTVARQQLALTLDRVERPELVLSIGLAGGLQPQLTFGQTVLVGNVEMHQAAALPWMASELMQAANVESLPTSNDSHRTCVSK